MPARPPREWFRRAAREVKASGAAENPRAVVGAMWRGFSPEHKRAIVALYERQAMAKKRKKKKSGKRRHAKKHTTTRKRRKKKGAKSVAVRVSATVKKLLGLRG